LKRKDRAECPVLPIRNGDQVLWAYDARIADREERLMGPISDGFRSAIAAAENGNADFFVTLEARGNADKWIQLTWSSINAAYPLRVDPDQELRRRGIAYPEGVGLVSWEADKFATFEHGGEPLAELVTFAERYAREILGVDESAFAVIAEEA
jgi:hypothetical protein